LSDLVPLDEARDESLFGSKAVGLGEAARGGLPIPPGFALAGSVVEAVASGDDQAIKRVADTVRPLGGPLAVRSSAADEDGAEASFAGQHLTLLNVPSAEKLSDALREIWWSANSDSAISYRKRVGLFTRPSVGVVVQALLNPEAAGVMFTCNPITGADEQLIEASWGLGEAVVAGLVIPDLYRMARSGEILERRPGFKKMSIVSLPEGGTTKAAVAPELVETLCLGDAHLEQLHQMATRCEEVYGPARDIEWALTGDQVYLLQCRAVTAQRGKAAPATTPEESVEVVHEIPLFAELGEQEIGQVTGLFKERRFAAGETVTKEGAGGAAFFIIRSGDATVSVGGQPRPGLGPGDYFGEIALIDGGERAATVTAVTDLVCLGLTYWDFRPLVQNNAAIAWGLLQSLARLLRAERAAGQTQNTAP
jgi:pyruvate,water dikinase